MYEFIKLIKWTYGYQWILGCAVTQLYLTLCDPMDCSPLGFGRNDAEAETPVLWPPHAKSWLIGKDPDAGRDWGQEEKGMTEDEMAGWHHQLYGHEFEWTPGVGDGQGGLACCDSWGCKEPDTTERLNWTELNWRFILTFVVSILISILKILTIFSHYKIIT